MIVSLTLPRAYAIFILHTPYLNFLEQLDILNKYKYIYIYKKV